MWPLITSLVLGAGPTWSLFPEGTTELREDLRNNKANHRQRVTTRVTRQGGRVSFSIEKTDTGAHLHEAPVFAEASALTELAVSPDGQRFDLRCVKQSQRVHSPDMTFLPPVDCDGGFVGVRSKKPKTVVVLVCRVGADAEAPVLVFAPGQVLERVYEDNDCSLAEGLRFLKEP
jgi:hypothetical protein